MEGRIGRGFFHFLRDHYSPNEWQPRWEGDARLAMREIAECMMDLAGNIEREPLYYSHKIGSLLYAVGIPVVLLKEWMRVCAEKYLAAGSWRWAAEYAQCGLHFDLLERIPKDWFGLENKMKSPEGVLDRVLWAPELPWAEGELRYALEIFGGVEKDLVLNPSFWQAYIPELLEEFRVPHIFEDFEVGEPAFFEISPSATLATVNHFITPVVEFGKRETGYIFPFWEDLGA